jgi:hypothetical protein
MLSGGMTTARAFWLVGPEKKVNRSMKNEKRSDFGQFGPILSEKFIFR